MQAVQTLFHAAAPRPSARHPEDPCPHGYRLQGSPPGCEGPGGQMGLGELLQALCDAGASVDARNARGQTALQLLVLSVHRSVRVPTPLTCMWSAFPAQCGVRTELRGARRAVRVGWRGCVRVPHRRGARGKGQLERALRLLLEQGADPNARDPDGRCGPLTTCLQRRGGTAQRE